MIRQHDLLLGLIVLALLSICAVRNDARSDAGLPSAATRGAIEAGRIYCAGMIASFDRDGDDALCAAELHWSPQRFAEADRNGDGKLSRIELTIVGTDAATQIVNAGPSAPASTLNPGLSE